MLRDEEGGFLMCTFWLAQVYIQRGELECAEATLQRAEGIAGGLGLYAEAVDARNNTWLGNTPLLFSQIEYARAALALSRAQAGTDNPSAQNRRPSVRRGRSRLPDT